MIDTGAGPAGPALLGLPLEFVLFAVTLLGVALLHHRTLEVALSGLGVIVAYKLTVTGFKHGSGLGGLGQHLAHEWVTIANLLLLLLGFAILAQQFERSRLPEILPGLLPDGWTGGLMLLVLVFVLSGFLDNIAAAIIGGTAARKLFRGAVHIGFLAALVASANAGGSGSVIGDTTTTMMWIGGIGPLEVAPAYIAAAVALLVIAIPAARQQHAFSPIVKHVAAGVRLDWGRGLVVALILAAAVGANVTCNLFAPWLLEALPVIGLAVAAAVLLTALYRVPDWSILPAAARGAVFLLALVLAASLMPVESLPPPSWQSTLGLGYVSAVFDNIPLTALALRQGGYDWALLAYAVGYGGSMLWFGSSAGVALASQFPEARSALAWLRHGWHVALAYPIGFVALLLITGTAP